MKRSIPVKYDIRGVNISELVNNAVGRPVPIRFNKQQRWIEIPDDLTNAEKLAIRAAWIANVPQLQNVDE